MDTFDVDLSTVSGHVFNDKNVFIFFLGESS